MALELDITNLYTTGRVITFSDGREKLVREKLKIEPAKTDLYYTLKKGDMWDELAFRNFDPYVLNAWQMWWVICDMNHVKNPLYMAPWIGREIVIPNIQRVLLILQ